MFEVGDEVLALVTPDSEDEMRELLTGPSDRLTSGSRRAQRAMKRYQGL